MLRVTVSKWNFNSWVNSNLDYKLVDTYPSLNPLMAMSIPKSSIVKHSCGWCGTCKLYILHPLPVILYNEYTLQLLPQRPYYSLHLHFCPFGV